MRVKREFNYGGLNVENSFNKRLAEIKNRDTKIIEGSKLKEDFEWLIAQAEIIQRERKLLESEYSSFHD